MDSTKSDFEQRKNEIDDYYTFLEIINRDETLLKYKNGPRLVEKKISTKLQTMFIANAFLLLYNLMESTVRNSIITIYDKIESDNTNFENLSEKLKKIWINQSVNNLKEGNFNQDTLQRKIQLIANSILEKETIKLQKENFNISGNIDAKKIRILADAIGFEKSQNGRNLENIKNKRNRLAHGEQTFYDVGKDYTFNELNSFKQETFDYLSDVIEKIETFIADKKYIVY